MKKFLHFLRYKLWLLPGTLVLLYLITLGMTYIFGDTSFLNWCGIVILCLLVLSGAAGFIWGVIMWVKNDL